MTDNNEQNEKNEQLEESKAQGEQEPSYPPLKDLLVQYTGVIVKPQDNAVTLEMVINTLADQFPELVMALAEENFMRGYQQGIHDVRAMQQIPEKPAEECDIETDIIDAEFEMVKEEKKDE